MRPRLPRPHRMRHSSTPCRPPTRLLIEARLPLPIARGLGSPYIRPTERLDSDITVRNTTRESSSSTEGNEDAYPGASGTLTP